MSKDNGPSARARLRPNAELGRAFAALLEEPESHQLGVCGKLRIPYTTYKRWMSAEPREDDGDLRDFQGIVLEALDACRRRDMEAGRCDVLAAEPGKASAVFNVFKFAHENRFRRFYANDEDPKRLELTGKDGGAIETTNLSDAEVEQRLVKLAAKAAGTEGGEE